MLSTAAGATFDVRGDFTNFNDETFELTLLGFTAHGQYITPTGLGGYASLPFTYVSDDNNSETGLGNIELGALYAIRSSPTVDILLRAGAAINTADDDIGIGGPFSQLAPRLTDAYTTGLDTTWARAKGQVRYAERDLSLGASAGFDVPIGGALEDQESFDGLLNLAVSVGLDQQSFALSFGLSMIHALVDSDEDDDDENLSAFNANIEFPVAPNMRLFGTLGIPDLDNVGDNGIDMFSIGAGLRVGMK